MLTETLQFFNALRIPIKTKNQVFTKLYKLVNQCNVLNRAQIAKNNVEADEVVDVCNDYICSRIRKYVTKPKRDKLLKKNPFHVPPETLHISSFVDNKAKNSELVEKSSNMQHVSLYDMIDTRFKSSEYLDAYNDFNKSHKCVDNIFSEYCCGENFKKSEFFQQNTDAIQIQLSVDDFEPANPLKTKASAYKTLAIYASIRNIPPSMRSKLNNILLVVLCFSNDVKDRVVYNTVWEYIMNDIKKLEEVGITVGDQVIKGTLVNVSFDNLGGNQAFGFAEGFTASHYCRICEMSMELCKSSCIESKELLRTKDSYEKNVMKTAKYHLKKIKLDYKDTVGLRNSCVLNNLKNFHVTVNINVDLMHDFCEGAIPFLLKAVFKLCIKLELFSESELSSRLQFFNFGTLNSDKRPSSINLKKSNNNQNATQSYTLMTHLPFILYNEIRSNKKLEDIWSSVSSLLQIMQIVFSSVITEENVLRLSEKIETHLKSIIDNFELSLKPKHHFISHYPRVIRLMGPVVHMSMMRYESKHKFFTKIAHATGNFKNLLKTFSTSHQEQLAYMPYELDSMTLGLKFKISDCSDEALKSHYTFLQNSYPNFESLYVLNSLHLNDYVYKPNLFLFEDETFFKIEYVFCYCEGNQEEFSFLCKRYFVDGSDKILNSVEVHELQPQIIALKKLKKLRNKKSYGPVILNNKVYMKCENLVLPIID